MSSSFAPGDGRPPAPSHGFFARLLEGTARRNPRRLVVFLLGAVALSLLSPALEVPELPAALIALAALLLFSALSGSAAASVAAAFIAMLLPWAPSPSLLVPALALGPLLLRRTAWRGGSKRRVASALLTLLLGGIAAMLLGRLVFEQRVQDAAIAMPNLPAQTLSASIHLAPVESAAFALLLVLALISLWRSGVRGWFAPLRDGEMNEPQDASGDH